jgi:pyruvate/2-oxoglutarate dehydrogenase complex dihydrolipoamide dehydrogenase (E3) component
MAHLGITIQTHMPRGTDGKRVTARSKGKVERPFRTVKETHETLYHFHTPENGAEANLWLRRYLVRYNSQPHRSMSCRITSSSSAAVTSASSLRKHEDEDVSAAVKDILEAEGVHIRLRAECISFGRRGADIAIMVDCESGDREVIGSHTLLAVGRRPNTDDLGLDKAGVEIDKRGFIVVDDELRTSVPGVWALGDCNGKGAFTHTAYNDFEVVAANLLDNDCRRVSDRLPAYALYVDPPLGRADLTEAEARQSGRRILVGSRQMSRVARAVEKGETQGFIKIVVDADSHQILGAAILGAGGDEVVHGILDIMYAKAPYMTLRRAVHIHPTVSELVPTVLSELTLVP